MSVSTFDFKVQGDYEKLDNILLLLAIFVSQDYFNYTHFVYEGGQQMYTFRYSPEDGVCFRDTGDIISGAYALIHYIFPRDKYNCALGFAFTLRSKISQNDYVTLHES